MMQWESDPPKDFETLLDSLGSMEVLLSAKVKIGYDVPHDGPAGNAAPKEAQKLSATSMRNNSPLS